MAEYQQFRAATKADHAEIVRIAHQSPYTSSFSNTVMFSTDAAYERGWIRVAYYPMDEGPDLIVGFTCVRHKRREPVTFLYFIGVRKELRSLGLGISLMDDIMEHSPYTTMKLDVMKDNDKALKFYQRDGFRIVGEAMKGRAWLLQKEYMPVVAPELGSSWTEGSVHQ